MALTPIKKWKYPVVTNDPNKSSATRYYEALMLAQTGFYPVSVNKLVHGGIHFDEEVLKNLEIINYIPSKVCCIADGEVIAYRVNDNYQKVDYGDKVGFFSTGFVLVRHLLEMERIEEVAPAATPPVTPTPTTESQSSPEAATNSSTENSTAPAANALPSSNTSPATTTPVTTSPTGTNTNTPTTTGESSTASTPPATETAKPKQPGHQLYFYSLYMHLADTKYYEDNPKEPAPAFWEQDIYRVTEKGLDFVEGLNIRKKPGLKGEILAVLQAGTKVELNLELHTEDYKWYAVTSLKEGYCSIPVLTPYEHEGKKIIGWVFIGTGKQLIESTFDIKGNDKTFAKSKGLRVRDESKKNILTMLPKGTQIKISGKKKSKTFVELAQIVRDGKPTIPLSEGKKLVWSDNLENITRGKEYNQVVVLDKPYPIKAGDLVGHIGHNQNDAISKQKDKDGNYIDMATLPLRTGLTASQYKPSLHVECFTYEDFLIGKKKPKKLVELSQRARDGKPTIPLSEVKKMVWNDSLENIIRGEEYNQVVLDKPYPIKAGDLVGQIFHNQNDAFSNYLDMATFSLNTGLTGSLFKPSLHVECFTCDDLPTFITQTQTEAAKIPDEDKTLVGISKGAKLLASASKSDTEVGERLKDSEIKILSKEQNINWLQIEIQTSTSETKTLWIENSEEIQYKIKTKGNLKDLASTTPAWSKFPLQQSELTTSKNEVDTPPLLLNINDKDLIKNDKRAMDEKGTLWLWIEHGVDSQNVPIKGWTFIGSEGVKKVSGWEWFGFKQITETGSLKEFYLSAKKAETRNKDNASLEHYKPTLKESLTILDKQYIQNSNEYAKLTQACFKGISEKPHLTMALGRLLVNYKSEWYEELDAEGKRPEWEALNSEMTDDAENYLGYIKDGDEAKRDAYVSKFDESKQESIKQGLEQQRRDYQRFPLDYKDAPDKKLTQEQLELLGKINQLEEKSKLWEKTKEKATKMLWWDDVAKGLAKQSQQTKQSDAETKKEQSADTTTNQTETSSTLATLSQNGRAWFIHPVSMVNYFSDNKVLFQKGDKDEIIREINIRLAGFGGNVPTDEFTERTENMIKQFQRDYMKVEETGVVDMDVITAIDEFSVEYDLPSDEWVRKPSTDDQQMFCPCGLCDGFGQNRHKDLYYGAQLESTHRYEYPGIHRSLLWALKAVIFYLKKENSVFSFRKISSGYRCYDRNLQKNRRTTNHKGKALDIHFNKNGVRTRLCGDMDKLRKDIFNKYLGAKWDWLAGQNNIFNLESAKIGAKSWVHYDVRQFDKIFLKDEYFCKDSETLNGKPLVSLIING